MAAWLVAAACCLLHPAASPAASTGGCTACGAALMSDAEAGSSAGNWCQGNHRRHSSSRR